MNSNDKLLVSVDIDDRGTGLLSYFLDFKSNILGPEDFAIDGDTVYILNSIDNTVLEFKNGKFIRSYNAGLTFGIKIAAAKGNIYILRNDFSIMRIGADFTETMALYNIPSEAIVDFMAFGDKIYIVISDITGGVTYEFSFDTKGLDINMAKSYHGRIFDENTLYETQLFPYDPKMGGSGKVIVTDLAGVNTREIPIHTKHFLSGAQYLGSDGEGGAYLKIYESETNEIYQTILESRLSLIDSQGQEKYMRDLPEQYKSITNQDKSIDGQIYSMNAFKNGVEVIMTAKPDEDSTREYTSRLDEVMGPSMTAAIMSPDPEKTITREQIIINAITFHSFNWSCTEANLLPLPGWAAPRFVTGPGNYTSMPYCWGGNSTTDEYYLGMTNGGRVGNINSPGPALVPNTFGHDCSGFVGLCWGETQKYSTNTIQTIADPINSSDLKPGDALDAPFYHIVLFEKRDGWGNYILYESTVFSRFDRVSHTIRSISSLKNFIPLRYKYVDESNMQSI